MSAAEAQRERGLARGGRRATRTRDAQSTRRRPHRERCARSGSRAVRVDARICSAASVAPLSDIHCITESPTRRVEMRVSGPDVSVSDFAGKVGASGSRRLGRPANARNWRSCLRAVCATRRSPRLDPARGAENAGAAKPLHGKRRRNAGSSTVTSREPRQVRKTMTLASRKPRWALPGARERSKHPLERASTVD